MTQHVTFLRTELQPEQRMLNKHKAELEALGNEAEDIYVQTKLEAYLNRPVELPTLTYPEFFQWWQGASEKRLKKLQRKIRNLAFIHMEVMILVIL